MFPTDKIYFLAAKIHSTPEELAELDALLPEVKDWEWLVQLLVQQGSGPLFYSKLPHLQNNKLIPAEHKESIQLAYYLTLSRGMMLYEAFGEVIDTLQNQGIQLIVLKGVYLSEWLYKDIGLRQFSDLDLLIREEDGERSKQALKAIGYQHPPSKGISAFVDSKADFAHYIPLYKNNISVELHIRLHIKNERFYLDPQCMWQHAIPHIIADRKVLVPDTYDMLIHVVLHLHKHFNEGQVSFTSFNDIVNILTEQTINWQELHNRLETYNAVEEVYIYLLLVASYYSVVLPEHIISQYEGVLNSKLRARFEDYLHGATFEELNQSAVPAHLDNISQLRGVNEHLHYFRDLLFPSKDFMLDKYKRKYMIHRGVKISIIPWWMMYPLRWAVGVKGLIKLIIARI